MTRVQKARARRPNPEPVPKEPTKRIGRAKVFIGLAILIGAFTAFVAPGFAEFESQNKGDTGKGEIFQAIFDDGPTTITCGATGEEDEEHAEEDAGKVGWTVEKEGTEQKKASGLRFNIETWGKCTYVAAAGQEGVAELSACEMEVKEVGGESEEPVKIIKTCKVGISGCEIKIEPKNNTTLNTLEIDGSGEKNENMNFVPNLSSIVTEVNEACAPFGIQNSKTVTLTGVGFLADVRPEAKGEKYILTQGEVAAGSVTALAPYTFIFATEKITCPEVIYEFGPINAASKTLTIKPKLMGANKCNTENLGNPRNPMTNRVRVSTSVGCAFTYGNLEQIVFSTTLAYKSPMDMECEIEFVGSTANANECKRKIGEGQVSGTYSGKPWLTLTTKAKVAWITEEGPRCGGNEANGAHAAPATTNYRGVSVLGKGIQIGPA